MKERKTSDVYKIIFVSILITFVLIFLGGVISDIKEIASNRVQKIEIDRGEK